MATGRKWFKATCECDNCKTQRVEQFSFGQRAATADKVCKTCGCKGTMSIVGPAPKRK